MNIDWPAVAQFSAPRRLGLFIAFLLALWLPIAAPLYLVLKSDANLASIVTMVFLFGIFLILLRFWSRRVYGTQQPFAFYGLEGTRQNGLEMLRGLSIGLLFTLALFITESLFGWVKLQASDQFLLKIVLEGSLTGLGVGFAEELFFRGWLLTELERDYTHQKALILNGFLFAMLHFLKPWGEIIRTFPQFPALFLLGTTLVLAKRAHQQRLGICIGIHGGLVWSYYIFNIGHLIDYTEQVPNWVTGIDQNPLAGIMGIIFLSLLGIWMGKTKTVS